MFEDANFIPVQPELFSWFVKCLNFKLSIIFNFNEPKKKAKFSISCFIYFPWFQTIVRNEHEEVAIQIYSSKHISSSFLWKIRFRLFFSLPSFRTFISFTWKCFQIEARRSQFFISKSIPPLVCLRYIPKVFHKSFHFFFRDFFIPVIE